MKSRFLIALLALLLAVVPLTAQDMTYGEAPMLAAMVEAGELPPVAERVSDNPIVLESYGGTIGRYGGSLVNLTPDPTQGYVGSAGLRATNLAKFDYNFEIAPNIAESWELSDDFTSITIDLRAGLKWSDGHPVTTDDVLFWHEDITQNEELTPTLPKNYVVNGELAGLEIVDENTFTFTFAGPYPRVIDFLVAMRPLEPRHYLEQFHIDYNEDAQANAEAEGYDSWWESFTFHAEIGPAQRDPDRPSLEIWVFESQDSTGNRNYVRNPFYWVVDTEGNQLPYTDRFERRVLSNLEVLLAQTLSGEGTHNAWHMALEDFPLLKQNEDAGGYTANLYQETRSSEFGFAFNYTHNDPVLRELFNDLRFRQAASHAIDRQQIRELVYLDQGVARQPIADPSATFYQDGIDQNAIEFDIERANALLDEIGLEMGSDGIRLLPDGRPLAITMQFNSTKVDQAAVGELLKEHWAEVGINLTLEPVEVALYRDRLVANELDMGVWAIGGGSEIYSRTQEPIRWRPPFHWPDTALGGVEWYNWYNTDGASGEVPPEVVQDLYMTIEEWLAQPRGTDRYKELGAEILQVNADNLWLIGTIGLVPRAGVLANEVRNGPNPGDILSIEYSVWKPYHPEQWWLDE